MSGGKIPIIPTQTYTQKLQEYHPIGLKKIEERN
jgi:hypothetical protein